MSGYSSVPHWRECRGCGRVAYTRQAKCETSRTVDGIKKRVYCGTMRIIREGFDER